MENIENREFEFSFAAIFKVFKGKLKAIIAVALVSAMLGGVCGALIVFLTKKVYGNLLTFYLPISEQSNYSGILPLLESDIFLRKILVDSTEETYTGAGITIDAQDQIVKDENGQPKTSISTEVIRVPNLQFTAEKKELYKKYSFEKIQAQKTIDILKKYFNDIPYTKTVLKEALDRKSADYSTAVSLLNSYMGAQTDAVAQQIKDKIHALEEQREQAAKEKDAAEEAYNDCIDEYRQNELLYHDAAKAIIQYDEELEKILAPVYAEWKADPQNAEIISLAEDGIKYALDKKDIYPEKTEALKEEDEEKPPHKFLYVQVQINNEKEVADKIIKNIAIELEDFVKDHTSPSYSNDIIKATCVSVPTSHTMNQSSLILMIAKYIILFVAVAELILIAIIVGTHFKNKFIPKEKNNEQDKIDSPEDKDSIPEANE